MKAIMLAANSIRAKESKIVMVGGMESMSRSPFTVARADDGFHSSDHHDLRFLGTDRVGGQHDGLHTRTTHLVNRQGRYRGWDSTFES
jgi:acetyl-CoA acetyltransferase